MLVSVIIHKRGLLHHIYLFLLVIGFDKIVQFCFFLIKLYIHLPVTFEIEGVYQIHHHIIGNCTANKILYPAICFFDTPIVDYAGGPGTIKIKCLHLCIKVFSADFDKTIFYRKVVAIPETVRIAFVSCACRSIVVTLATIIETIKIVILFPIFLIPVCAESNFSIQKFLNFFNGIGKFFAVRFFGYGIKIHFQFIFRRDFLIIKLITIN